MNRRIALVAVAVVLALVGTLFVYNYAHNADERAIKKTRAVKVLIAQKRIPAGTAWSDVLKGGYLKQENVPVTSAPSGIIPNLNVSIPVDEQASADIAPGQVALRLMFQQAGAVTGALPIPKGKLAISISMSSNAEVAGYVQYQSQVAVFVTYSPLKLSKGLPATGKDVAGQAPSGPIGFTKLLLPRVEVIATSAVAPEGVNGKSASGGNVLITLALTQEEADKLILSQSVGQLYLALLSETSVTGPDDGVMNAGTLNPTPVLVKGATP